MRQIILGRNLVGHLHRKRKHVHVIRGAVSKFAGFN